MELESPIRSLVDMMHLAPFSTANNAAAHPPPPPPITSISVSKSGFDKLKSPGSIREKDSNISATSVVIFSPLLGPIRTSRLASGL
ncbi:hypothetical protein ES705_40429 [subsurface metagenome]